LNDQSNKPQNITANTGSYIIFHKHSRERSIDCTPKNDSTHEQKEEDAEKNQQNVDDQSEENFKRENEISVVHETNELSSRESIDSIVDDEESIRLEKSTENLLTNRKPPSPCQDSLNDQSNKPQNITANTGSYIIFHKHSRERSIDCTPKTDSTHEQKEEDAEKNQQNVDDMKHRF
jgi:hypothetical protein